MHVHPSIAQIATDPPLSIKILFVACWEAKHVGNRTMNCLAVQADDCSGIQRTRTHTLSRQIQTPLTLTHTHSHSQSHAHPVDRAARSADSTWPSRGRRRMPSTATAACPGTDAAPTATSLTCGTPRCRIRDPVRETWRAKVQGNCGKDRSQIQT